MAGLVDADRLAAIKEELLIRRAFRMLLGTEITRPDGWLTTGEAHELIDLVHRRCINGQRPANGR